MKKRFLVAYDYGQGAVWAFVSARSAAEIERRFPALRIFESPPPWLTADELEDIARTMSFDLGQPEGWLAELARARHDDRPRDTS